VNDVSAVTGRVGGLEVDTEDSADLTLRFESGAVASVHLDFIQRPPAHRLEITGLDGQIAWDNGDGIVRWRRGSEETWTTACPPPGFERNTLFVDEMRHFLDCVRNGASPIATLEDGIKVVELVEAAKHSAAEQRTIEVDRERVA
jgi:predicted dehydrogenase